jgi:PAS domain-containing protein
MSALRQELEKCRSKVESYLLASNAVVIVLLDSDLIIQDSNPGFMRLFNLRQTAVGESLSDYLDLDAGDIRSDMQLKFSCSCKTGMKAINDCFLIRTENGYLLFCERQMLTESRVLEQIGSMNNELINLHRELVKKNYLLEKLRSELDLHVAELEGALLRVKQLEGVIPICMYCKKIRDDQQSWHQLETYISNHSEVQFSHGMCPSCAEEQLKIFENTKRR